jgi:hypothetical protein
MQKNPIASKGRLAFVLYDAQSPPRYFEIGKALIRFVLVGLPALTGIMAICILVGALYIKNSQQQLENHEPEAIQTLKGQNQELANELKDLEKLTGELQAKLAAAPSTMPPESLSALGLFRDAPGAKDITQTPILTIEGADAEVKGDSVTFRCNLVNVTKTNDRVSGFIFVVMKHGSSVHIWPENSFAEGDMQVSFNNGEIFATQRFRPVEAKFSIPNAKGEAFFKILIFSRSGDLMHKQIISKRLGS